MTTVEQLIDRLKKGKFRSGADILAKSTYFPVVVCSAEILSSSSETVSVTRRRHCGRASEDVFEVSGTHLTRNALQIVSDCCIAELHAHRDAVSLFSMCTLAVLRCILVVFSDGTNHYVAMSCLREGFEYRGAHCGWVSIVWLRNWPWLI